MTLFQLFPWMFAICVALWSAALLRWLGVSDLLALSIGLISGFTFFLLFLVGEKRLICRLEQRRAEKQKSAVARRRYQTFDVKNVAPIGKSLFYECAICGNILHSLSKKNTNCACRNILIEANSGRIEIRDRTKVKLFAWVGAGDGGLRAEFAAAAGGQSPAAKSV